MTGYVNVDGYRQLIEPPILGDCDNAECSTYSPLELARQSPYHELRPGVDVLLVAMYAPADRSTWRRLCAPCDERQLRAWLT